MSATGVHAPTDLANYVEEIRHFETMTDEELIAERVLHVEDIAHAQAMSAAIGDVLKRRNISNAEGVNRKKLLRVKEFLRKWRADGEADPTALELLICEDAR